MPFRVPVPGSDGRLLDKHLPERLIKAVLDRTYARGKVDAPADGVNTVGPGAVEYTIFGGRAGFPQTVGNAMLAFLAGYDNHVWDNSVANHSTGHHGVTGGVNGHSTITGGSYGVVVGGYGFNGSGTKNSVVADQGVVTGGSTNAAGAKVRTTLSAASIVGATTITVASTARMAVGQIVYIDFGASMDRATITAITGNVLTLGTFQSVPTTALDGSSTGTGLGLAHASGTQVLTSDNTGQGATVGGGSGSLASGNSSTVPGGNDNLAEGASSVAMGNHAYAPEVGQVAVASQMFTMRGDQQTSYRVQGAVTTNATTLTVPLHQAVQPNSAVIYTVSLVAHDTATGDSKAWTINGAYRCNGTTVVTQIGGAPTPVVVAADTAAAAWTVTTLNGTGTFNLRVTGEASKTIRWVARVDATLVI